MKSRNVVQLGECCEIISGATPSTSVPTYWDGEIAWATPRDLSELDGAFIGDTPRKITKVGLESCAASILPAHSVLFSSRAPIGHVAINTIPMATNQGFKSFVPDPEKVHAKFLYWWLRTKRPYLETLGNGATFKEVSKAVVSQIEIPLPPLQQQRRIAEVLDRAEVLRAKRRAALAQLDTLTQSIFLDLFGDPRFNEKNWHIAKIRSVISSLRGGANLAPDDFAESGFPILHKGAIKANGEIALDGKKKTFVTEEYAKANSRSQIDRTYLAVTLRDLVPTGPTIGLIANLKTGPFEKYLLAQGAYGFRVDPTRVTREYLVCLSNMPNFRNVLRQYAVGSTQIHIRTPLYLEIPIPVPPLEIQQEFSSRVNVIKSLRATQQTELVVLNNLFESLQRGAFMEEL